MNGLYYYTRLLKKIRGAAIKNSSINKTSKIGAGSQVIDCIMDRYSYCGYDCVILNSNIGAFVSIADNVTLGGAKHPYEWVSMSPVFYRDKSNVRKKFSTHKRIPEGQIIIESDVWIGKGAFIAQGVRIGVGAVIGMGAVVTKDVEPYTIVAGNPAREIKRRFSDEIIGQLKTIKWWNWEDSKIQKYAHTFNDIDFFLESIKQNGDID